MIDSTHLISTQGKATAQVYRAIASLRPWALLEQAGHSASSHAVIAFGQADEFCLAGDTLTISGTAQPAPRNPDDLLAALRAFVQAAPVPQPKDLLPGSPFEAGVIGFTAFDFFSRIEQTVGACASRDTACPDMHYAAPRSMLVIDKVAGTANLLHAGTDQEREALLTRISNALDAPMPAREDDLLLLGPETASLDAAGYMDAVRAAKEHIAAGDAFQIVLAARFEREIMSGRLDTLSLYEALLARNPSSYMLHLQLGARTVVGASPESLVTCRDGVAKLRPIAGTRPRGIDDKHDLMLEYELLKDEKEAAEHVMLVDLARNDLGRVAQVGTVSVEPSRVIERYSHVMHMVSGVQGRLARGIDGIDCFASAFPAGTVSGAPKVRACQIIDDIEPISRGLYAGAFGWFSASGDTDHAICIRSVQITQHTVTYQAGAGIVADSCPQSEWDEVCAKSAAAREAVASLTTKNGSTR